MDGDEEIGLDPAGLLHAGGERHVVVVVPRQHGTHSGLGVDDALQLAADRERHMFFVSAALADGARIFASMSRIECYGDLAPAEGLWLSLRLGSPIRPPIRRALLKWRGELPLRAGRLTALLQERHQGIERRQRIEIEG